MITSEAVTEPAAVVTALHRACADEVAALAFDMRFPPAGSVPAPRGPVAAETGTIG